MVCSLFSGSSGNSVFVRYKNTRVLIDCGKSAGATDKALTQIGESSSDIAAFLITHEHIDHIRGINVFAARHQTNVYATEGTWDAAQMQVTQKNVCRAGEGFSVGDILIKPFRISHDAREPVGYSLYAGEKKITIATDMGIVTPEAAEALVGSETVVLESNHDYRMLLQGRYPYFLKERILGKKGHLSNKQCAEVAAELVRRGTKHIMLAHLSDKNNLPQVAYATVTGFLKENGIEPDRDVHLTVAPREGHLAAD